MSVRVLNKQMDSLNKSNNLNSPGLPEMHMKAQVLGATLPECFYRRALANPDFDFYFSKSNGNWRPMNYKSALDFVFKAMAGLKKLGFKRNDKIVIFAENREEWILTDYAAQWMGGATAAIYTTSTPEQIEYVLNESDALIAFVSSEAMLKKISDLKSLKCLRHIIAWDAVHDKKVPEGVKFISRDEFLAQRMEIDEAEELLKLVRPDDLAVLLYTSGTTGEPKGVQISHHNLVCNLKMFVEAMPSLQSGLVTISFLPLSHIYERSIHNLMVAIGLKVYFAESMEKLIENIAEVRPEVMTAVPRIFEKMYARVNERIKSAPWLRRKIFYLAQAIGQKTFDYRYRGENLPLTWELLFGLADAVVFKKIRAITGGRAKLFISGGAPISVDILNFFFRSGFTILEGYGISETCILSVNRVEKFKFGTVGRPFPSTQIKIAEDGEILVKGPQVMRGYYKRPDADREAFTADGWYRTGDIGEIDLEGFLKITDRKKELIITAGGKNIPPQPIENALKKDSLVESACVIGDTRRYISVLIVPNWEVAKSWGAARGLDWKSLQEAAQSQVLKERFRSNIESLNKDLPKYSTLKDFRLVDKPFAIETGELTPTLKLKRRIIQEKYKDLIDSMYPSEEITS